MTQLNLPPYNYKTKTEDGKNYIWDIIRKQFLVLTPEEHVRQCFLNYMIMYLGYPQGLTAVEYPLKFNGMNRRGDIVVFSKQRNPALIVECKAPGVKITNAVFEQIARYNMILKVEYLVVTNGLNHYACKIDFDNKSYNFIREIPHYKSL